MQGCCCHFPRSSLCNPIQFIQARAVTICKCEGQALAFLGVLYNPHLIHQDLPLFPFWFLPVLLSSPIWSYDSCFPTVQFSDCSRSPMETPQKSTSTYIHHMHVQINVTSVYRVLKFHIRSLVHKLPHSKHATLGLGGCTGGGVGGFT